MPEFPYLIIIWSGEDARPHARFADEQDALDHIECLVDAGFPRDEITLTVDKEL